MNCKEHREYTGQRKPRTDCKQCLAIYESKHAKPEKAKKANSSKPQQKIGDKKEEKPIRRTRQPKPDQPKPEQPKPSVAPSGRQYSPIENAPDRLLCLTQNQYRNEMTAMLRQLFPRHIISLTGDASLIVLEDKERNFRGFNTFGVDGSIILSQKPKEEALKDCERKVKAPNRGDVFFSEKLKTPIILISYNKKTKLVYFREWFTKELVYLDIKEFEKLDLREVIFNSDFQDPLELEVKVLTY